MRLDRIAFDNMQIPEQIEYINTQLADGKTLREITSNINIARSTLRDRFFKEGYNYNKAANTYLKLDDKSIIKVSSDDSASHKNNTFVSNKDNEKLQSIEDFNKIKNDLIELINNKNDILQMLNEYKSNTKIIDIPQLDINSLPGEMQKDITTKSVKVYEPIYKLFDAICKDYNSIKKQDLISLALLEFYNKYKK